ncbi:glycosyltransferase [Streptomyces sp. NBC_00111]|uniref:glycosyltransferase family 2 protein n=1 Tax=unclassified Streptomyces TaxID=2593676 RepID=UPI002E30E197|nr:glycosyltransferase [Streptomyces sp. NBC_01460]
MTTLHRPPAGPLPRPPDTAHGDGPPGRLRGLTHRAAPTDPALRHGMRRLLVLLCLMPLLIVLAHQAARLPRLNLPVCYGLVVLAGTIAMLYVAYSRYEDPAEGELRVRPGPEESFPPLTADPRVSFLLAVKDEVDGIEACVRSMAASDCPGVRIIVVDDHSQDGTGAVLDRLRDELGITVIHLAANVGKKNALVRACELADTEIIAFTDSDCVLAPDALRRCVRALVTHPELGAVSGHCRALNTDSGLLARVQDVWYEGQFRVAKAAEASFGSVSCVSGPLAVFRRDAVYNYLPAWADDRFMGAPFRFATDRQLTGYVLGQAWTGRALKRRHAGSPFVEEDFAERRWRVGYVRSAKVWTDVPARFGPLLRQQIRWKKSFIRNLFFTGSFMWRRGPGPAALYYGHALWVLAAPVMAFLHLVWAPLHGALFLTLLYFCGVVLKGCVWGLAYRIDHPGDTRWRYRPLMSLFSSVLLAWLLPYSLLTVRRGVWSRGAS